ncbi:MAG: sigma-70 family RNA polymerase sigma factor [Phycisphaerales bacterium]|nr:sigma-70 family RNA polymerase sigma factor [Phycisphaerales bacterium]
MKVTRQQFEALALEQIDLLYRVARRLARDPHRAEDLVQETYVRAIGAWESFDLQAHGIKPWLLRILHNLHYSQSLRDRRHPVAVEPDHLDAASAVESTALDQFDPDLLDQNVASALNDLPGEYQNVLMLWAIDGLSYKEIALAVDIPIGTVMSRLHRARQKLSDQLKTYAKSEGIIRK